MLSKWNVHISKKITERLNNHGFELDIYEFMPEINLKKDKFNNFIVLKKTGNNYVNSLNIVEKTTLTLYVKNWENFGNEDTPELILYHIVETLKKIRLSSLPVTSAKEYNSNLDLYYYTIDYMTPC